MSERRFYYDPTQVNPTATVSPEGDAITQAPSIDLEQEYVLKGTQPEGSFDDDAITFEDGGGAEGDGGGAEGDDGGGDDPGGDDSGGGGGGGDSSPTPEPLGRLELAERFLPGGTFSTEEIMDIFASLGRSSMPQRQALFDAAISHQRALSEASPSAILQEIRPQVGQIRKQLQDTFKAVSRRLGSQGGGQIQRGNASALQQAAQALQGSFATAQSRGTAGLHSALQGFTPALASSLPQPTKEEHPFDPSQLGASLAGAASAAARAFGGGSAGYSSLQPNPATTAQAQQFGAVTSGPAVYGPFE